MSSFLNGPSPAKQSLAQQSPAKQSTETQRFIRSRSVASRIVAGETLLVPIRGKVGDLASIYSFNGTGTSIWKLLETPKSVAEVVAGVAHEYDAAVEQVEKDVKEFLHEMLSVGLAEVPVAAAMAAD
ncbi:MAG TPA: PqqD family protein [Candidatus Sulfotelmatobacter sp.]